MARDHPRITQSGGAPRGLDAPSEGDDVPDFGAARQHTLIELVRFASDLRSEGVRVPASASLDAARALSVVGLGDRDRVADALRATLLSETTDVEPFESAFPTFWHRLRSGLDRIATAHDGPDPGDDEDGDAADDGAADDPDTLDGADPPDATDDDNDGGDVEVRIPTERQRATGDRAATDSDGDARRYSAVGGRERVEVAAARLRDEEAAAVDRFVAALSTLPGRRRRRSTAGEQVEARRALRASLETGGVPMELPRSDPVPAELRCCLLIDVSGSVLDTIDRSVLLSFADRLYGAAREAGVFLFDTDLTEVTAQFAGGEGDPAAALREAEIEWGGGTKIGGAFAALRGRHPHAVDRRTVVIVVSDGLDVGDQERLSEGITWLADRAGAVVWLNPLAVSPEFEPRSRGMSTALPYLDALFGFAGPSDLGEAARQIEQRGLGGPVGFEYDPRRADDGGDPA
jgi:uncharacterized protein with von Willebrand factor type A (vWA) domain